MTGVAPLRVAFQLGYGRRDGEVGPVPVRSDEADPVLAVPLRLRGRQTRPDRGRLASFVSFDRGCSWVLTALGGMLRMRKAQIEQNLAGEQTRLRRIEAHLRALERGQVMELHDVVIKNSEPVRLAEAVASAPGFGTENIGPVFRPLFQQVRAHLRDAGVRPGINIARYEGPAEDGRVILHVGFDIGSQDVTTGDLLRIVDLPPARVAALVHRGTMEDIAPAFEALIHWTKDSGYTLAGPSRELYHHWDDEDPAGHVTELQLLLDVP
jgi:effector-binding domain-containing protein